MYSLEQDFDMNGKIFVRMDTFISIAENAPPFLKLINAVAVPADLDRLKPSLKSIECSSVPDL
jgi:hypothetical protein